MEGKIHLYFGEGKGKTTAAFGLAARALGRDMTVLICQFLKGTPSGEALFLKNAPRCILLRDESTQKFVFQMNEIERAAYTASQRLLFERAVSVMKKGGADLLILDEALGALELGILSEDEVVSALGDRLPGLEVVLTGRKPTPRLLKSADYASRVECVKHPFDKGIPARKGIEF